MNINKILLIARREYWYNFRRRSFLFTAFVVPLITFVGIGIVFGLLNQSLSDTSAYQNMGIVDKAGVFTNADGSAEFTPEAPFVLIATQDEAAAALNARTLDGYYVLDANFLASGAVRTFNRQDLTLNEAINNKFTAALKAGLASKFADTNLVARLIDPLDNTSIYRIGSDQELDESALFGSFLVPFIFVMIIFSAIMGTSQFLMSGLAEEKENRMMEMFLTSARPSEMLWGKVLGLGALGLTQLLIWAAIGLGIGIAQGSVDLQRTLANFSITPSYLFMLLAFFVLGYLVYGTLMAGMAALFNTEQEGRQYAGIFSIVLMLPIFFIIQFLENPNAGTARFLSLFPLTAPSAMIMRASWTTVSPEEIALSIALMVAAVIIIVWISARLLRLGMLNYGKKLSLPDILRGLLAGRSVISASEQKESEVAA